MEEVILVDRNDQEIGVGEKMQTHIEGKLHRAFSVFVFNKEKELLLQRRALSKYHSPGIWSNTCCSHPRPGETVLDAGKRRLVEEMGFQSDLEEVGSFVYKVKFENGLTEYEYDHVLVGSFESPPQPNPEEVEDWKWIQLENLAKEIERNAEHYSFWIRRIMEATKNKEIRFWKS